jgi:hypothetical protein
LQSGRGVPASRRPQELVLLLYGLAFCLLASRKYIHHLLSVQLLLPFVFALLPFASSISPIRLAGGLGSRAAHAGAIATVAVAAY